jgi:hypothetical protein
MTFDEWWATLTPAEHKLIGENNAKFVWDAATTHEREACAKVCQDEIGRVKPLYSVVAENIFKAVVARGQA